MPRAEVTGKQRLLAARGVAFGAEPPCASVRDPRKGVVWSVAAGPKTVEERFAASPRRGRGLQRALKPLRYAAQVARKGRRLARETKTGRPVSAMGRRARAGMLRA
jgi:hypothetical protein